MRLVQLGTAILLLLPSLNTHAFDWRNLWSTPEQRAAQNHEEGDFDTLVQEAPNAAWQGVGEYRKGDYQAASESFAKQHEQAVASGSSADALSAQYNRANAELLSGNYEQALNLYDEVLEGNPEHEDATHNAEIAKQLWKQQEQQRQQDGNQNDQQDGDQQDSDSKEQQQGQSQDQDQQQQNGQSSDQSNNQQQAGDQQGNQNVEQSSAESQQAEEEKAAEALQAERNKDNTEQDAQPSQASDQQGDDPTNQQANTSAVDQLTEQEQATEQWLRQIPDDPAGLLQRKLQNRHMTDYPEVKDSAKPW